MTTIKKSVEVPYSAEQMYTLVNNIEAYPEFLPGCRKTVILSRTSDEVRASVHLSKGGIQHSFSTLNRLQANKMIEVRLLEGPFRQLQGYWRFDESAEGGCRVQFDLEFTMLNRLLDMTVGPVLEGIANRFVEAFCERARAVYGSP